MGCCRHTWRWAAMDVAAILGYTLLMLAGEMLCTPSSEARAGVELVRASDSFGHCGLRALGGARLANSSADSAWAVVLSRPRTWTIRPVLRVVAMDAPTGASSTLGSSLSSTPSQTIAYPGGAVAYGQRPRFGAGVAGGYDLDGDGHPDLVVGTPGRATERGSAYVYTGASGGFSASGREISGLAAFDHFGRAAVEGGFDPDGSNGLAIGAPDAVEGRGMHAVLHTRVLGYIPSTHPLRRLNPPSPRGSPRILCIYGAISGQLVRQLLDRELPAGRGIVEWDGRMPSGSPAAAGDYFVRLTLGDRTTSTRLTVVR